MIEVELDGRNFSDMDGFYNEVEAKLTKGLDWKIGRSLNAFNDVLRCGFGVHDYEESLKLRWINSEKSKVDFGFEATVGMYQNILQTCHPRNKEPEKISNLLAKAERKEGEDLFAVLVSIIGKREHINFEVS